MIMAIVCECGAIEWETGGDLSIASLKRASSDREMQGRERATLPLMVVVLMMGIRVREMETGSKPRVGFSCSLSLFNNHMLYNGH